MIAISIVAILSAITIPSYRAYILKSNRNQAEQIMLLNQQYLERFYSENGSYLSNNNYPTLPYPKSPSNGTSTYDITFESTKITGNSRANSYLLIAIPIGNQDQTGMTVCLDSDGNMIESATKNCS